MNICFFGSYARDYPRNKILIDGLEKNGCTIFHCHSTEGSMVKRYPELTTKYWKIKDQVDIIFVGFVGHLDMPLAWLLARLTGKKVVFDMFYSMYDTYVYDRQSARVGSLQARIYSFIDKAAWTLADHVISDTQTHGKYFMRLFHVNPRKFTSIFVGGDDTVFSPPRNKTLQKKLIIEFHGMFTRLHGAEYFVKAAKLLENEENLEFLLIGSTANYPLPIELYKSLKPKNMRYYPKMTVERLAKVLASSDISVGHIGTTEKAQSVITNKTFHALFSRVATIVGDCAANKELLTNRKNALFVKIGDEFDLAKKIKILTENAKLRQTIAEGGHDLAQKKLTNAKLGNELLKLLKKVNIS